MPIHSQQRIVTLTILFAVLRDLISGKEGADLQARIHQLPDSITGQGGAYRVTVRQRDADFFKANIQAPDATNGLSDPGNLDEAQYNMLANAVYFREALAGRDRALLIELAQFALLNVYLAVVSAPDRQTAWRIFNVLNNRGLDLTAADILKSEIISGIAPSREFSEARAVSVWEASEVELGRDAFEEMLRHLRTIYAPRTKYGALADEFSNDVFGVVERREFVKDILPVSTEAFDEIKSANVSLSNADASAEASRLLSYLQLINWKEWEPIALAVLMRARTNPDTTIKLLAALEKLAWVHFVIGTQASARLSRFIPILQALTENDFDSAVFKMKAGAGERGEAKEILDGPVYQHVSLRLRLLKRLNACVTDGGDVYDPPKASVEHVLPQNPPAGSPWLTTWPSADVRAQWVHRIGNLALLNKGMNSQASNLPFEDKKRRYVQRSRVAPFALTIQIVNEPTWNVDVVKARQRHLIDTLKQAWDL